MGNLELGKTSHLFYNKCITVVSTILLYHMYGTRRRFVLFFSPRTVLYVCLLLEFNVGEIMYKLLSPSSEQ